jgi:hypothetical protein
MVYAIFQIGIDGKVTYAKGGQVMEKMGTLAGVNPEMFKT